MKFEILEESEAAETAPGLSVADALERFRACLAECGQNNVSKQVMNENSSQMQDCLDKVLPSAPPTVDELLMWMDGYESIVRPFFFELIAQTTSLVQVSSSKSAENYITALQHYETLLSQRLQKYKDQEDLASSSITSANQETTIYRTIRLLCTDLDLLTSERYFPSMNNDMRNNIVLQTMLRLLERVLQIVLLFRNDDIGEQEELTIRPNSNPPTAISSRNDSLRRCVVSLLAFVGESTITPCHVSPSLLDSSRHNVTSLCCFPPKIDNDDGGDGLSKQDMCLLDEKFDLKLVDWDSCALSTSSWNSSSTRSSTENVWKVLVEILQTHQQETSLVQEVVSSQDDNTDNMAQYSFVVERLGGWQPFFKELRAHFFGRDMLDWQPATTSSQQIVLGRQVTKTQPLVNEPPYQSVPSRIAAALNGLRLLSVPNNSFDSPPFWNHVFDDAFPMVASLVDSNKNVEIALGASGFLCILDALGKTSVTLSQCGEGCKTFVHNTLSLLDAGFKTCGEGATMVVIGQAQTRIYELLQKEGGCWEADNRNRRRKATQQWLVRCSRGYSSQDPATKYRHWELLVGGVVPLLLQHARNKSIADGLEFGRQGLASLLQLILNDDYAVDKRTQTVAMIALTNLMVAAHPIMPHHGGKILSTMLGAAAASADGNDEKSSALHKLAVFAGAVALVICGPKFTDDIFSFVGSENENGDSLFQERITKSASRVKALAAKFQQ